VTTSTFLAAKILEVDDFARAIGHAKSGAWRDSVYAAGQHRNSRRKLHTPGIGHVALADLARERG
jgi:hypothetical protein